jgi:hypothetical protein
MKRFIEEVAEEGFLIEHRRTPMRSILLSKILDRASKRKIEITRLEPKPTNLARPNSLSSRHGLREFPKHTDYATSSPPPRYIALHCPVVRTANTIIYDAKEISSRSGSAADAALFRLSSKHTRFSVRFKSIGQSGTVFRFNSDCMVPINEAAIEVAELVTAFSNPAIIIDWSTISTVLFDNWTFLHSRTPVDNDSHGWLWRIAIWSAT